MKMECFSFKGHNSQHPKNKKKNNIMIRSISQLDNMYFSNNIF